MSSRKKLRLGLLGSGKGSNFLAIAEAAAARDAAYEIALVISDLEDAGILERARSRGIPAKFIAPGKYRTKLDELVEPIYIRAFQEAQVDLVVLAGFMRILK